MMLKKERAEFISTTVTGTVSGNPCAPGSPQSFRAACRSTTQRSVHRYPRQSGNTGTVCLKPTIPLICSMCRWIPSTNSCRPCGLAPQKSSAISNLSKILVEEHSGEVPDDWKALEALPGVGHKTASVVMSQGFGHPAFPVDTHIHRLAQRWGLTKGKNVAQTEKDLKKLFPREQWNALHLQIIFYGREYCSAREAVMVASAISAPPAIPSVKIHLSPISPNSFAMLTHLKIKEGKYSDNTLYGIKNCDTIKKARNWLTDNGIEYQFHDVRGDGIDAASHMNSWIATGRLGNRVKSPRYHLAQAR